MGDQVKGTRLEDEEELHLKKYWNDKFPDFVHAAFKQDIVKTTKNTKKNKLQNISTHMIYLGFGAMFLFYTMTINNLLAVLIAFLMGIFFVSYGGFNLYLEWKNR